MVHFTKLKYQCTNSSKKRKLYGEEQCAALSVEGSWLHSKCDLGALSPYSGMP